MVVVEAAGGGERGIGYSYTDRAAATLVQSRLAEVVRGRDAMDTTGAWNAMRWAVRNVGLAGIAAAAISAVDVALWDLKARLLQVPLVTLLGAVRERVPIYGSGGFTSYTVDELQEQVGGWAAAGIRMVKMKVGSRPESDLARVRAAREAIGSDVALFVDANGAYRRKEALAFAHQFAALSVTWFEEPVPSADVAGLRLLRDHAPAPMDIAAGEYGADLEDFARLLEAGAVDVLQADATRCQGISGLMRVAALCEAHRVPLSAHTAPALHLHPCCALTPVVHVEYFHDHVRLEPMLFDGVIAPVDGALAPDVSRPGLGLELKRADAARFAT